MGVPRVLCVALGLASQLMMTGELQAATTAKSVSYKATVAGNDGAAHAVEFKGSASGTTLAGTLTIDAVPHVISGAIAPDGSISGKLSRDDGKQVGVFWGRRAGSLLKGSFDLGGKVGDWSVPANRLPVTTSGGLAPAE